MGLTSTSITLQKEPSLFNKKPRLLAFSPNIIFGRWAKRCGMSSSPHFIKTNNHDEYSRIAKMDATQMNRFIYSYVRLYNGRQVSWFWFGSRLRSVSIPKSSKSTSTARMIATSATSFAILATTRAAFAWSSLPSLLSLSLVPNAKSRSTSTKSSFYTTDFNWPFPLRSSETRGTKAMWFALGGLAFFPSQSPIQSVQMWPRNAPWSGQQRSAFLVCRSRSAADFLRYG